MDSFPAGALPTTLVPRRLGAGVGWTHGLPSAPTPLPWSFHPCFHPAALLRMSAHLPHPLLSLEGRLLAVCGAGGQSSEPGLSDAIQGSGVHRALLGSREGWGRPLWALSLSGGSCGQGQGQV